MRWSVHPWQDSEKPTHYCRFDLEISALAEQRRERLSPLQTYASQQSPLDTKRATDLLPI